MNDVIGIIPARSGSKGVPGKNILLLNGHPLIAYSIAALKLAGIKRVVVSTDSKEYSSIAKYYGAEVPFLRPDTLSADNSTDYGFMIHAMNWFKRNEPFLPEYWLHIRPTSPLRDPKVIEEGIKFIKSKNKASSLRSGHEAPESPFKWLMRDEDCYFFGLRKDLNPEKVNLPRQSFPVVYVPNGYVDIVRSSYVLKNKNLHGDKMLVFNTPLINEIDTIEDFNYIKYKLEDNLFSLDKYLNNFSKRS